MTNPLQEGTQETSQCIFAILELNVKESIDFNGRERKPYSVQF